VTRLDSATVSYLRLVAILIFCATSFAFLGIAGCVNAGRNPWIGVVVGTLMGLLFGLAATGMIRGKQVDAILPPGDDEKETDDLRGDLRGSLTLYLPNPGKTSTVRRPSGSIKVERSAQTH
jgi:hypothetical protein